MKITIAGWRIMVMLFKTKGSLKAYTIFQRLRLNYADFHSAIIELSSKELISISDNTITILESGKELVFTRKNDYLVTGVKSWRKIPEEFLATKVEVNDFYIPSKSKLDAGIIKKTKLY